MGHRGFNKNVNEYHYPYFLITCWLQSGIQDLMCDERSVYYKVYVAHSPEQHYHYLVTVLSLINAISAFIFHKVSNFLLIFLSKYL